MNIESYNRPHETSGLSNSANPAEEKLGDIAADLWGSFATTAIKPLKPLAGVLDRSFGTDWQKNFADAPEQAQFGTGRYWAQQFGSAAGTLPWFALIHKGTGAAFRATIPSRIIGIGATGLELERTFCTGMFYDQLFNSSDAPPSNEKFKKEFPRTLATAASFTIMEAASMGIARKFAGRTITEKIGANFLAGLVGGAADAHLNAIFHGRLTPTKEELGHTMATYGVLGAGLSAVHALVPRFKEVPLSATELAGARTLKGDPLLSSGLSITPATRLAALNEHIAELGPGAREAAVRTVINSAKLDWRMSGIDAGSNAGSALLGDIARTMPKDLVETAIAIDASTRGKAVLSPHELQTISTLRQAVNIPAETVYQQMNNVSGLIGENLLNMPDLANTNSLREVQTVLRKKLSPEDSARAYDTILSESAERVRVAYNGGIGHHLSDPVFARELDVYLRRGGYLGYLLPTNNQLNAAKAILDGFGTSGFSAERAQALQPFSVEAHGLLAANEVLTLEALNRAGITKPTKTMLTVARQLELGRVSAIELRPDEVQRLRTVAGAIDSVGAGVGSIKPVEILVGSGIPVTRENIEVAKRWMHDPQPGRLNAEVKLVASGMSAAHASEVTTNAYCEYMADSTGHRKLISPEGNFDWQGAAELVGDIQRAGGFDGKQLANCELFHAAYEAYRNPTNPTRLASINAAERLYGVDFSAHEEGLKIFDEMINSGGDPAKITLQRYFAAQSIQKTRDFLHVPAGDGPRMTPEILDRVIADPTFDVAGAPYRLTPAILSKELWAELCKSIPKDAGS